MIFKRDTEIWNSPNWLNVHVIKILEDEKQRQTKKDKEIICLKK